ncbi:MAG: tRNA uridine(34) 5-carboxymethylaminomethyl modification radical SAM/GNAT enzyme Elp3 [Patescibacteria group bacterium]|nr:tRNA uridine(34) 5-carboxymethylaminomethyl modification radical SAM/GNAT enzyme Elp3 [Patescibacteria group bacterium]
MDWYPLVKKLLGSNVASSEDLAGFKRRVAKEFNLPIISNNTILRAYRQLIKAGRLPVSAPLLNTLRRRKIRTLSGVAVITALTKPYPCPGKCVYCPAEDQMPKSYLVSEPAAQRAFRAKFDPHRQVKTRIATLQANGHATDKIELIVLGGTWSAYPAAYQTQFIKRCFDAANGKIAPSLSAAQKRNERSKNRIIGLTIETRPDFITPEEIRRLRELGVTRVQIGVQTTDDRILKLVKRGHDVETITKATKLLREAGLKINYHLMPGLPGATPAKDIKTFREVFTDPRFKPDFLKLYPTVVLKNSPLYRLWKRGKYKPYSERQLMSLIPKLKALVPRWVRIERLVRDIPGPDIVAGSRLTNLRQVLNERGVICQCIRCREARASQVKPSQAELFVEKYRAAAGDEYFISFEDKTRKKLYAFLRLRLPNNSPVGEIGQSRLQQLLPVLKNAALIRELHTYGQMIPVGRTDKKAVQHLGFGKRLMLKAERLARQKGYKKIAVISGIGVREYYRKIGYKLRDTYMVKQL